MKTIVLIVLIGLVLAGCGDTVAGSSDLAAGADLSAAAADLATANDLGAADLAQSLDAGVDLPSGPAGGCLSSGGSLTMSLCCISVTAYPNSCAVGACSCAPASSHMVPSCSCPSGKCFDGAHCV